MFRHIRRVKKEGSYCFKKVVVEVMINKKETGCKIIEKHITTAFNRKMYRWRFVL